MHFYDVPGWHRNWYSLCHAELVRLHVQCIHTHGWLGELCDGTAAGASTGSRCRAGRILCRAQNAHRTAARSPDQCKRARWDERTRPECRLHQLGREDRRRRRRNLEDTVEGRLCLLCSDNRAAKSGELMKKLGISTERDLHTTMSEFSTSMNHLTIGSFSSLILRLCFVVDDEADTIYPR